LARTTYPGRVTTDTPTQPRSAGWVRGVVAALFVDAICAFLLFVAIVWDRLAREGIRSHLGMAKAEFRDWLIILACWGLSMVAVAVVGLVRNRDEVVLTQVLVVLVVLACWEPTFQRGWDATHVSRPEPTISPQQGNGWQPCFGGHGDCPGG
jgi:hypothetical protein